MPRTGLTAPQIKQKAIEATMMQMRHAGFENVRLTEVAKALGLSHAALYAHFRDKTALFDAVSEQWLLAVDESLAAVCKKAGKTPTERIRLWFTTLHRAKLAKITNDPELYKSFDLLSSMKKPYVRQHMDTMHTQLVGLVKEAIAKRRLGRANPETMAEVLWESMMAFHHPKLAAQHVDKNREPLLRAVLTSVLAGLGLQ